LFFFCVGLVLKKKLNHHRHIRAHLRGISSRNEIEDEEEEEGGLEMDLVF
jgi:hypothetical protein